MKKVIVCIIFFILLISLFSEETQIVLRYSHMNNRNSVAARQAEIFKKMVFEKSNGRIKIEIFPESQLGSLKEMVDQVSNASIAIHHNTMAAIGTLVDDISALDTPYLYDNFQHFLKCTSCDSPVIEMLNEKLVKEKGVKILYTFYFGTRVLTCNKPVYSPEDLKDVKIRAIPFPMYKAAVKGLGAIPAPIDISNLSTALSNGFVSGQENPLDIILTLQFYKTQKYLIMTRHIIGAECVVINDSIWEGLSDDIKSILLESAKECSRKATQMTFDLEESELKDLIAKGMTVIDKEDGLKIKDFIANTRKVIKKEFGNKYNELYKIIDSLK